MKRNRRANPSFRVLTGGGGGDEPIDMFADYSRQLASGADYLPFLRSLIDHYGGVNAAVPGKSTVPISIGSTLLPLERTYAWAHINTMADYAQAHLEVQFPVHFPSVDHPFERWRNIRYAIHSDASRVTRTAQDFDRVLYADGRAQWQLSSDKAPIIHIAVTNRELSTVYNLLEAGHTKDMPGTFLPFEPDRAIIEDLQLPYAR